MTSLTRNATEAMARIAESSVIGDISSSRKALLKELGDIKADEILHNQVLVALYIRPTKTRGGIITTDKSRDEDMYQGSIGLVIGLGPGAFKDDKVAQFHGKKIKLNDWVLFVPADGIGIHINGVPCRLFQDTRILMRLANPQLYWS